MMNGVYTGRDRVLKGKAALIRDTARECKVIVQFVDPQLPREHTHGWKMYPAGQFKITQGTAHG